MGDVTGNITGDVTGDATGDTAGWGGPDGDVSQYSVFTLTSLHRKHSRTFSQQTHNVEFSKFTRHVASFGAKSEVKESGHSL